MVDAIAIGVGVSILKSIFSSSNSIKEYKTFDLNIGDIQVGWKMVILKVKVF